MSREVLTGKTVLVTGGSSGIGNSIARGLVEKGANVFIISRRSPDDWEVKMPNYWSSDTNWINVDLNDLFEVSKVLKDWLRIYGEQLDVFIHSAINYGSNSRRPLSQIYLEEWLSVFTVNMHSLFLISQLVLPFLLRQPKSLIIPISSEVAFNAGPGRMDYAASKASAVSFTRSLSAELKGSCINMVSLLPKDMIDTPGIRRRRSGRNFDLSSYVSPDSFIKPAIHLVQRMGDGYNNQFVVVDNKGEMNKINISDHEGFVSNTKKTDVGILRK